jgi:hypothetical protein
LCTQSPADPSAYRHSNKIEEAFHGVRIRDERLLNLVRVESGGTVTRTISHVLFKCCTEFFTEQVFSVREPELKTHKPPASLRDTGGLCTHRITPREAGEVA